MKIKLDENLPEELRTVLALIGADTDTVPEEGLQGRPDEEVLSAASRDGRLLLTQDMDFSDARRFGPGSHSGIVLIRIQQPSRRRLVERVRLALTKESLESWAGHLVVITDSKIRVLR